MTSRTIMTPCVRIASRKSITPVLTATTTTARLFHVSSAGPHAATTVAPADPGHPRNPSEPLAPTPSSPVMKQNPSIADRIALSFRDYIPNTTETYVAFDITRELYTECASQAAYADGVEFSASSRFWYETCARPPTFQSWSQVTVLHMWMLAARMRALDRTRVKVWQQHFIDHFFYDAEDKMARRYGIKRAGERAGYMKDLYHQYRGMTAAFDEGLIRGDAVLAAAIWRNLFNAADDVDVEVLAMVASHVRRCLSKLGTVDDDVVLSGRIAFGLPQEEKLVVNQKSRFLDSVEGSIPAAKERQSASMAS